MQPIRFTALDTWRGICAMAVALGHLKAYSHFYDLPFLRSSFLFVDFFFVLSGFVISHAYLAKLESAKGLRAFVIRRFGRLWPLHATILLAFIVINLLIAAANSTGIRAGEVAFAPENFPPQAILTNAFLIHGLGIHDTTSWNAPSWSISAEFFTYLVFAALCYLLAGKTVLLRATAVLVSLLCAAILLTRSPKYIDTTFEYGFVRCLFGFLVGYLTYCIWQRSSRRSSSGLELVALATAAAFVWTAAGSSVSVAAPLVFAFVVWTFANESGAVSVLMKRKWALRIGLWSYSIYMVHWLALVGFGRQPIIVLERVTDMSLQITREMPDGPPIQLVLLGNQWVTDAYALLYGITVIAIAAFTYRFIEQPGRRFFNSLSQKRLARLELAAPT